MKEEPKWYANRLMPETELHTHINAIISGTGFVDFVAAIETIMGIAQEDMTVTIRATDPNGITDLLAIPLFEKENGKVKIDPETEQPIKNPLVVPLFCQSKKFAKQREIKIVVNGINYTIDNCDYLKAYQRRSEVTSALVKKMNKVRLLELKNKVDTQILPQYIMMVGILLWQNSTIRSYYKNINSLIYDLKSKITKEAFDEQLKKGKTDFYDDINKYLDAYERVVVSAVKTTIALIKKERHTPLTIENIPKINHVPEIIKDYNREKEKTKQRIHIEHLRNLLKEMRLHGIKYVEISTTSIDRAPNLNLPPEKDIPIAYFFLYQIRQKASKEEIQKAINSFINTDERFIGIDIAGDEIEIEPDIAKEKISLILKGLIKPGKTPTKDFKVLRIHASEFDGMNDNALNYLRGLDKFIESEKAKGKDYMPFLPEIRIGHGIRLPADNRIEYIRLLKKYNVTIEINPSSNYLLGNVGQYEDLADTLEFYLSNDIPLVVSTDGNGLYGTTLYNERLIMEEIIRKWIEKKVNSGNYDIILKEKYDLLREEERSSISLDDFKKQKIAERIEIETAEMVQRILDTNNQRIHYVMEKIATETLANLDESLEVNANIMDDIKDEELKKINEKVKKDNENIKEYQTDFSFKPPDRWWEAQPSKDPKKSEEVQDLLKAFT